MSAVEFAASSSVYDDNYREWKSWPAKDFAVLKPSTARYYSAEMSRAGMMNRADIRVLEIGFGNGAFLSFCKQQGWSVVGTEIDPALVTLAKQAGFDARPAAAARELQSASFDLVAMIDVLEHIAPDEAVAFLQEAMRILRPGGALFAHFPNGDSPFGLCFQNGDATHVNVIGSEKARYYARAVGAEIVVISGEAQPIPAGSWAHTAHRLLALPFRLGLNWLVRLIFLPGAKIDFSAPNLTMVLRKV